MPDRAQCSRVKLAIVTTVHRWGDPRVFERNARAAVEAGLDVHAFVPGPRADIEPPDWPASGRFTLHKLPLPRTRLQRLGLALGVWKYLKAEGEFDAVHFHDPELIPAMLASKMRRRVRIIYDIHEELPVEVFSKPYLGRSAQIVASGFARLLWKVAAKSFDAFAPATEKIANYWPRDRCRVVHNYPRHIFAAANPNCDPDRLVFVGGLMQIRGLMETITAVKQLRSDFPKLTLELYGPIVDLSLHEPIQAAIEAGWCRHVPWLCQADLISRLQGAGIGLVPYLGEACYVEALPTKLFEYMALGIPALVSDFPLWKQIVSDANCGIAVAPTAEGLLAGIREMRSDSNRLKMWSENGRQAYLRHYQWENEAANLLWLYRKIGLRVSACGS